MDRFMTFIKKLFGLSDEHVETHRRQAAEIEWLQRQEGELIARLESLGVNAEVIARREPEKKVKGHGR